MSSATSAVLLSWVATNNDPYERERGSREYVRRSGEPVAGPSLTLLADESSSCRGRISAAVFFYQRSHKRTYEDLVEVLAERVPPMVAYRLVRTLAVGFGRLSFDILRTFPRASKKALVALTARQLGPTIDIKHFTPRYNPWDERMCVVPDGDLFSYLRKGKASVVTDTIAEFTPTGVRMDSGEHVDADIIVTATGLNVLFNGGITMTVDGEPVDPAQHLTYKAVMLEGVPNAAFILGYTNASWTLKADLAAQYVCRLLTHMSRHGYTTVVAQADAGEPIDGTIFGSLTSGYVQRAADQLPKQGTRGAWKVTHDYIADQRLLGRCSIADEALVFGRAPAARRAAPARKRRASV